MSLVLSKNVLKNMRNPNFVPDGIPCVQVIDIEAKHIHSSVKLWDGATELSVLFVESARESIENKQVIINSVIAIDKYSRISQQPDANGNITSGIVFMVEKVTILIPNDIINQQIIISQPVKIEVLDDDDDESSRQTSSRCVPSVKIKSEYPEEKKAVKSSEQDKLVVDGIKLDSLKELEEIASCSRVVAQVDLIHYSDTSENFLFTIRNEEERLSMHCVAYPPIADELRVKIRPGTVLAITNAVIQKVIVNHALLCSHEIEMVLSKLTNTIYEILSEDPHTPKRKKISSSSVLKSTQSEGAATARNTKKFRKLEYPPASVLKGTESEDAATAENIKKTIKVEYPAASVLKVPKSEGAATADDKKKAMKHEVPKAGCSRVTTKPCEVVAQQPPDDVVVQKPPDDVERDYFLNLKAQQNIESLSHETGCQEIIVKIIEIFDFGNYGHGFQIYPLVVEDNAGGRIRCTALCTEKNFVSYLPPALQNDDRLLIKHAKIITVKQQSELRFESSTVIKVLPSNNTLNKKKKQIKINELKQGRRVDYIELKKNETATKEICQLNEEFIYKYVLTDGENQITAIIRIEDMELFENAKDTDIFRIYNAFVKREDDNIKSSCTNTFLLMATFAYVAKISENGFETSEIHCPRMIQPNRKLKLGGYVTFKEVAAGKYHRRQAINVVGVVTRTRQCEVRKSVHEIEKSRKLDMIDSSGCIMGVTFWKATAILAGSLKCGDAVEIFPGHVSHFRENYEVSVNHVSSLWVDPTGPQVDDAKASYDNIGLDLPEWEF